MYGGVRFGGTLPIEDAWAYGFDHVAIAAGAGRPTIIDMKNNLIRGIRKASDFLMALQLTGAFKRDALPNLQARLPAVVIGGGLTAIDTATELMAYYPVQVEKTLPAVRGAGSRARRGARPRRLRRRGARARSTSSARTARPSEPSGHARPRRASAPDFVPLVREWGGVTIAYRKRMVDSPAYRLNHEEVIKALEEGIALRREPESDRSRAGRQRRSRVDDLQAGRAGGAGRAGRQGGRGTRCHAAGADGARGRGHDAEHHLREGSARTRFSSMPRRSSFSLTRRRGTATARSTLEPDPDGFFTSYERAAAGHVLRRQPSALRRQRRQGDGLGEGRLPADRRAVRRRALDSSTRPRSRSATAPGGDLVARTRRASSVRRVEDVVRLTPTIVEVIVKAPAAARHFHPGQFYRLQNYESVARRASRPRAAADGRHRADRRVGRQGERAAVADRARARRVEPARGVPAARASRWWSWDRPERRPRFRRSRTCCCSAAGSATPCCSRSRRRCASTATRVIYFAGYKNGEDLFKREEIEAATDQVIWSTDMGAAIARRAAAGRALPRQHRPGDAGVSGGRARPARSCRSTRSIASSRSARTA